jgi:hypothetical protein
MGKASIDDHAGVARQAFGHRQTNEFKDVIQIGVVVVQNPVHKTLDFDWYAKNG